MTDPDLHSGAPVWEAYPKPRIKAKRLTRDIETDILIVGAGISGAMMAEALSGHGRKVVVVDKDEPLHGSTAASTALLQFELDMPLTILMRKVGRDRAVRAWRRSRLGLESLAAKIRLLDIPCDYERRDSLYLAGNILDKAGLEDEARERAMIGLPARAIGSKDLSNAYGIAARGAILNLDNVACNPVQLAGGLLNHALSKGVKLYRGADIIRLDRKKTFIDAVTMDGRRIRTRDVVFATGYDVPEFVRTGHHMIKSTYALSTRPVKTMPENFPFLWEASDPYCYGRTTADGRMIFGGFDEEFKDSDKRDALIQEKTVLLEKRLTALFPAMAFETERVWAGSFGASGTGLPFIGRIPHVPHCYTVMGFGGNGITFSSIAADIISAQIFGCRDPDEDLFSLARA